MDSIKPKKFSNKMLNQRLQNYTISHVTLNNQNEYYLALFINKIYNLETLKQKMKLHEFV